MANILMYCTPYCPYCIRARSLLERKGVEYTDIDIGSEPDRREEMEAKAGGRTSVPQIFIDDRHIGGFDDMAALDRAGELDPLLWPSGKGKG